MLSPSLEESTPVSSRSRETLAQALEVLRQYTNKNVSFREASDTIGIPRSTLQYWDKKYREHSEDPAAVAFFESPIGLPWLHRFQCALHLVFNLLNTSGLRLIELFLELTGLDAFIASSYGAQQSFAQSLQKSLITYAQEEQARLAANMPEKRISTAHDETFHPDICLVAIEPVSNFI